MKNYELICFCKWCQNLPLPELAKTIKDMGFDGVDLPVRPGSPITHENAPDKLPEAAKIFKDHGLKLARLVTSLEKDDAVTEKCLETVASLGIRKIRIDGYSVSGNQNAGELLKEARKGYSKLEKVLAKHGVRGAVQNHSGQTLDVNISSCLRMIEGCDPAWVGIQYDPGHLTLSGEPVKIAIELMGPYLHSANLKSPRQEYFIDPQTKRLKYTPIWCKLRDGMLDVPEVLEALSAAGYADPISIHAEYRTYYHRIEHDIAATNKIVAEDVAYLKEVMSEKL